MVRGLTLGSLQRQQKVGGGFFYLPAVTSAGPGVIERYLEDRPPTFISDDN